MTEKVESFSHKISFFHFQFKCWTYFGDYLQNECIKSLRCQYLIFHCIPTFNKFGLVHLLSQALWVLIDNFHWYKFQRSHLLAPIFAKMKVFLQVQS